MLSAAPEPYIHFKIKKPRKPAPLIAPEAVKKLVTSTPLTHESIDWARSAALNVLKTVPSSSTMMNPLATTYKSITVQRMQVMDSSQVQDMLKESLDRSNSKTRKFESVMDIPVEKITGPLPVAAMKATNSALRLAETLTQSLLTPSVRKSPSLGYYVSLFSRMNSALSL